MSPYFDHVNLCPITSGAVVATGSLIGRAVDALQKAEVLRAILPRPIPLPARGFFPSPASTSAAASVATPTTPKRASRRSRSVQSVQPSLSAGLVVATVQDAYAKARAVVLRSFPRVTDVQVWQLLDFGLPVDAHPAVAAAATDYGERAAAAETDEAPAADALTTDAPTMVSAAPRKEKEDDHDDDDSGDDNGAGEGSAADNGPVSTELKTPKLKLRAVLDRDEAEPGTDFENFEVSCAVHFHQAHGTLRKTECCLHRLAPLF
jgi:hypothetical protein